MFSLFRKSSPAAPDFFAPLKGGEAQLQVTEAQREAYQGAAPFAHTAIDDMFNPDYLRRVVAEVPSPLEHGHLFNADVQHLQEHKFAWRDIPKLGPQTHAFLGFLGSKPFLEYLTALTGVAGLMPDPYMWGAGFHQILRGGKLAVHADFNIHPQSKLYRRLNVLVYLNEEWDEQWGGALEFWNHDMTACETKVAPHFNRMAVFSTTEKSFHGHPNPLDCPENVVRKSLALYYYTYDYLTDKPHSNLWKDRPQDEGKVAAAMQQFQQQ